MASNWRAWVADRFGWGPIRENALDRRVAKGSWYYGDGATLLFLLGVLVVTGALLSLTYSPTPETAYPSVRYITEVQYLGWFIRGLHYWCAGLMVVMLLWHLFRLILVGGYKSPREGTWLIGVVMFFAIVATSVIGYLLRGDERAAAGARVVGHVFHSVPGAGEDLVVFVQGSEELGPLALTRLYSLHVVWVPLLLLSLAGYHLYLVMHHGVTSPTERELPVHSAEEQRAVHRSDKESEDRGETFYPTTMVRSGAMAMVVFGLALALTLLAGAPALMARGELVGTGLPAEEWWMWWYSGLAALLPPWLAPTFYWTFPLVLFVVLVALPFVDRGPRRGIRNRPVAVLVVIACVLALLFLSDYRRRSPFTAWPDPEPPPLPRGVEGKLDDRAHAGRLLFAKFGCNSCHPIAGHGRQFARDLAHLGGAYSRQVIRDYVLQPPAGVAMPSYRGRMTDEELERVVEFVHVAQTFPRGQ